MSKSEFSEQKAQLPEEGSQETAAVDPQVCAAVDLWLRSKMSLVTNSPGSLQAVVEDPDKGVRSLLEAAGRSPNKGQEKRFARMLLPDLQRIIGSAREKALKASTQPKGGTRVTEIVREDAVASLIEKVEQGFPKFHDVIRQRVAETGGLGAPYLRPEELYAPFEFVEINTANPVRNKETQWKGLSREINVLRMPDPNYFYYDRVQGKQFASLCAAAGYSPTDKTMYLSERLDPANHMEMLVLYHELRHVAQDTLTRAGLSTKEQFDRYIGFHRVRPGEKPRVVLSEELTAYAYEIEILNILSGGKVKSRNVSPKEARGILGAREDQDRTIDMLLGFARAYYPDGMAQGAFSDRYTQEIKREYGRDYELYAHTTTGGLMRIS